jgi:hypothetical protein
LFERERESHPDLQPPQRSEESAHSEHDAHHYRAGNGNVGGYYKPGARARSTITHAAATMRHSVIQAAFLNSG